MISASIALADCFFVFLLPRQTAGEKKRLANASNVLRGVNLRARHQFALGISCEF
jgi:hypothetical protein